jgi:hypothetical protein
MSVDPQHAHVIGRRFPHHATYRTDRDAVAAAQRDWHALVTNDLLDFVGQRQIARRHVIQLLQIVNFPSIRAHQFIMNIAVILHINIRGDVLDLIN